MTGEETSEAPKRFVTTPQVTVAENIYSGEPTARRYLEEGPGIQNWVSTILGIQDADAEIEVEIVGAGHDPNTSWHLDAVVRVDGEPIMAKDSKGRETKTWHVEGLAKNTDDFRDKTKKWEESERRKRDNLAATTPVPTSASIVEGSSGITKRLARAIGRFNIKRPSSDGGGNTGLNKKGKRVPPNIERDEITESNPWALWLPPIPKGKNKKDKGVNG